MLENSGLDAKNRKAVTKLSWGCKMIGDYFMRAHSIVGDLKPGESADYEGEVIKHTESLAPDILQSKADLLTHGEGQVIEPDDTDSHTEDL